MRLSVWEQWWGWVLVAFMGIVCGGCSPTWYGLCLISPQNERVVYSHKSAEAMAEPVILMQLQSRGKLFGMQVRTPVNDHGDNRKATSLAKQPVEVIISVFEYGPPLEGHILRLNPFEVYLDIRGRKVYPTMVKGSKLENGKEAMPLDLRREKAVDMAIHRQEYNFVLTFEATYAEMESGKLCIGHITMDDETVEIAPIRAKYGPHDSGLPPI